MSKEQPRAPLSTEVSPVETGPDRQPSGPRQPETAGEERLTIGQRLSGRYRIEGELGEGGMGVVYLAADEQVGQMFALKVLKAGTQPGAFDLLREEVRKTRKLSHPNIVDVHLVNVDGTKLYVVMEYLEGKPLNALLDEDFGRGMPFSRAWPIIEDVGAALGYAHDHSVIHSDLKPANIFVTMAGKTKLLDFGIARVSRGPLMYERARPLALTPLYASCEMLEGEQADARDDIYSFGCVIYEMLCGKRPFGELTALEARAAGVKAPPLGTLSKRQNAALAKALAFHRKDQTGSVEELLTGLADDRKSRARSAAVVGGAVVTTLVVVTLIYLILDERRTAGHSTVPQSVAVAAQQPKVPAVATSVALNPPPRSIAVLPFVDISERHDQEYFSDGLSEEMIDRLSQSDGLRVIARTSSFYFKGKQATIGEIARTLNVGHILEGSVRKSGHEVRITVQLISCSDGSSLWSRTYERNLVDIFKVQDEIAGSVAGALKAALASAAPTPQGESAAEAYNLVLEADFYFRRHEDGDPEHATELYRRAVHLDPNSARAQLAFAAAILHLGYYHLVHPDLAVREAREATQKALAIDPASARAHRILADIESDVNWNWAAASAQLTRALELASTAEQRRYALESIEYLKSLQSGVYSEEYERMQREDLATDPLDTGTMELLADILTANNRVAEAIPISTKLLQLTPNTMSGKATLGLELMYLSRYTEALAVAQTESDPIWRSRALACIHWAMGKRDESDKDLVELTRMEENSFHTYLVAEVHACRGETDAALEWLNKAHQQHSASLPKLKLNPMFRALRGNPRFHELQVRMRLAD
jgi:TolB-like protein/predicted Ser/Thr protein kinase